MQAPMTILPNDQGEDWIGAPRSFVMMTNDTLTSNTTTTATTPDIEERYPLAANRIRTVTTN